MSVIGNPVILGKQGGGGAVEAKDVNFYDYDGTIVASYTAAEFANLSAMPANPTHEGLTAQGWNWSLADAKTYVASYGMLEIGQMYVTSDGKTRLHITLDSEEYLSPYVGFGINGTAVIDWGDGTATSSVTGTSESTLLKTQHTYSEPGNYVVSIEVISGFLIIRGISTSSTSTTGSAILYDGGTSNYEYDYYRDSVYHIELGNNVDFDGSALSLCHNLQTITIPAITTHSSHYTNYTVGYAFYNCSTLKSFTVSKKGTGRGDTFIGKYSFYGCTKLSSFSFPWTRLNYDMSRGYPFSGCYALKRLTIPTDVNDPLTPSQVLGTYFCSSSGVEKVCFPADPCVDDDSYGYQFISCSWLRTAVLDLSILWKNYAVIPKSMFQGCSLLKSVKILNSNKITKVGSYAFSGCASLPSFEIPANVTTIGAGAFNGCTSLKTLKFKPITPPTVANSNAFGSLPTGCIIYVPSGSLSAYTGASNYPSSSTYTYVEYDP